MQHDFDLSLFRFCEICLDEIDDGNISTFCTAFRMAIDFKMRVRFSFLYLVEVIVKFGFVVDVMLIHSSVI